MKEIELHKRVKIELTSAYKLQMAESYIKKLNQQIGSDGSYIEELEDFNKKLQTDCEQLRNEIKTLQDKNKVILDKYSQDIQKLKTTDVFNKLIAKNKKLEEKIEILKNERDLLIYRISCLIN